MLHAYIDPFIGVDPPGHCLCGPYLPFSLVRLGPDTVPPQPTSGYSSDQPILRFSHTHVSGTGGGGRYGNIGITPYTGVPRLATDPYTRGDETAAASYYGVTLQPAGIRAELTSTPRVGVHHYRFPAGSVANILIDLGAIIQVGYFSPANGPEWGYAIGGVVEWLSKTEVSGRADLRGGWGHQFPYSVYFYAVFDVPAQERIVASHAGMVHGLTADGPNCKAIAHFGVVAEVNLRVGISYTSIAKARRSVERETQGRTFDVLRTAAAETWEQALSRIEVAGGSDDQRRLFYTLFSRLLCMPSDLGIDDEFPLWESGVRHFTDYYALWDSVRNANSLISLFDPELEVALLNCLLDIAEHTGWLPDAWVAGHSAQIQGGSSADILFCEAVLKGLPSIDYEQALHFMRKNNEVESPDPWLYGRHLADYRDLGYVSTAIRRNCVSRHLEYAYQDWCIGTLARQLGYDQVAERYYTQSRKLWNVWRDDLHAFAPKQPNGQWAEPFDPTDSLPDSWNDPYFYEGTSRQWSWNTHHDFAGLVRRMGGPTQFVEHLDRFFDTHQYRSKETMLHVPYLYIYAGRPDRTAERVRQYLTQYFNTSRQGLSDNEDMGCQSAWYMCSTLGFYPVMGQDLYLLTSPLWERATIRLGNSSKQLIIETSKSEPDAMYTVAATLNGQPLDRAWIRHHEIIDGATLRFQLASAPSSWGTHTIPPSPLDFGAESH